MRSMDIAATGMLAQQLNVETISNNIANLSTTGFKRQRAEFQDLLYQNQRRVGSASSDQGTIVPAGVQVGIGVKAAAVYRITEQGNLGWYWNFSFARMNASPYGWLSMVVWACCWIIPFWVLLGAQPKKTPVILGTVGFVCAFGFWLERNLLVWPSLAPQVGGSWVGLIQFGIAAGFLGAFSLVYLLFTRVVPALAVPSPRPH